MIASLSLFWRRAGIFLTIAAVSLAALSITLGALTVDTSYDGQEYHFDAVYALVTGWNPIWEAYGRVIAPGATVLPWPGHYPTGSWILMALLREVGLGWEASKGVLLLPAFAAWLAWSALLRRLHQPALVAHVVAALAAVSPILLVQTATRMNDGVVSSLVSAFVAFGWMFLIDRRGSQLAASCASLALALDVKFNAVAICGALSLAMIGIACSRHGMRIGLKSAAAFALTLVITIVTLGFHPYVTNTFHHGQPFWPVIGAPELEINSALIPEGLAGHSPVSAFVRSLFGSTGSEGTYLKVPFAVSRDELIAEPDTAVGGFGPLFSGAILIAVPAALLLLANVRKNAQATTVLALALAAAISALVTPYAWWPRFIPQFWLVPLLVFVGCILATDVFLRWIGLLGLIALSANWLLVLALSIGSATEDRHSVMAQIEAALTEPGGYCGAFGAAHARIAVLREAGAEVYPLTQHLPLACRSEARDMPKAWDFDGNAAQSCSCAAIAHDADGSWTVPPDRTVTQVQRLHAQAR